MKIAILLPDAKMGGAQNVLLALSNEFVLNHPVEFLCLAEAGDLHNKNAKSVPFRFLISSERLGMLDVLRAFLALVRYMRVNPDTVMLSTGTGTSLLACAAHLFAPNGAKLVVREACSSRNSDSRMLALLKRRFYPLADGMIGVSDGVAEELREVAGKNQPVASIPNPVDAKRLAALADLPDSILEDFPYPYLLTVGRLVPQKNTALLIDAFAEIAQDVPEHLVIIGGGPLESNLRQQAIRLGLESRVHILGEISNPHPWYKKASAFALPSDWEGYPNVLIEALAHGLKVLATDCEFGPRQILADGKYGELVPVGDERAMAKAVKSSLQSRGIAKHWDVEAFSPQSVAIRYLAFMRNLLS